MGLPPMRREHRRDPVRHRDNARAGRHESGRTGRVVGDPGYVSGAGGGRGGFSGMGPADAPAIGHLAAGRLVAAVTAVHRLTVVTRNVGDSGSWARRRSIRSRVGTHTAEYGGFPGIRLSSVRSRVGGLAQRSGPVPRFVCVQCGPGAEPGRLAGYPLLRNAVRMLQ